MFEDEIFSLAVTYQYAQWNDIQGSKLIKQLFLSMVSNGK